jgi:hypothetical protein
MQERIISLDDIWLVCMLCGRMIPAEVEPPAAAPGNTQKPVEPTLIHEPAWAKDLGVKRKAGADLPAVRRPDMSNTLANLNESLFDQLNRLSDAKGEELKLEIERSKAMSGISREIIDNAKLALEAHRITVGSKTMPKMLECDK